MTRPRSSAQGFTIRNSWFEDNKASMGGAIRCPPAVAPPSARENACLVLEDGSTDGGESRAQRRES